MKKFGFEREFFVFKDKKPVLLGLNPPKHPILGTLGWDGCGYLAETRSEPHTHPIMAAHLLLAADEIAHRIATHAKMKLVLAATHKFDVEFLRDVRRKGFGHKGKHSLASRYAKRGNIYGHDYLNDDLSISYAGLHVHFSDQQEVTAYDNYARGANKTHKLNVPREQLDIPRIVRLLDKAFESEIKRAGRLPGFYEIKGHGFEYRSLPATVDVLKVADVLVNAKLHTD